MSEFLKRPILAPCSSRVDDWLLLKKQKQKKKEKEKKKDEKKMQRDREEGEVKK